MINRLSLFSLSVIALATFILGMNQFVAADVDETEAISGENWQTAVEISTNSLGGRLPVIEASPNGSNVMVAYLRHFADTRTAYFRESTNNGETWAAAQAIGVSGTNETAVAVDIAYDGAGNAHAIWTTLTEGADDVHKIYYAKENNWPSSTAFSQATNPGIIKNPAIAARGNVVVLVWAENPDDTVPTLYYRFSTASGGSMSSKAEIDDSFAFSGKPDVAIGSDNKVHLVWQEGDSGLPTTVYYMQGTIQGGVINWSSAVTLAAGTGFPSPNRSETLSPQIDAKGTQVFVSYTKWNNISNDFTQSAEYRSCSSNCTNINNWQSSELVSGQFLGEDMVNPFSVKSTITQVGSCSYVYFHGIPQGQSNEQILGVNSCNNWFANGRDEVTPQVDSSINPKIESQNDWFVYLVYEDISDETRSVWFVRNDPNVYLPVITK